MSLQWRAGRLKLDFNTLGLSEKLTKEKWEKESIYSRNLAVKGRK